MVAEQGIFIPAGAVSGFLPDVAAYDGSGFIYQRDYACFPALAIKTYGMAGPAAGAEILHGKAGQFGGPCR